MQHPEHEAIAAEVASWYRNSFPDMGIEVVPSPYGYFRTNASSPEGWATIADVRPDDVHAMLDHVASFYGDRPVELAVEDATYSPAVGVALEAAGWTCAHATVWLARVDEEPIVGKLSDIDIERMGADRLDEFSRTKLMGFADSEDEPTGEEVSQESALRRTDLNGVGVCLAAWVADESAAICAYYTGTDYLIFLLATRVPFRHRGLARTLISCVHDEARRTGARSTIINADEGGLPEALYRSLGFSDVVYRQWRFKPRSVKANPSLR